MTSDREKRNAEIMDRYAVCGNVAQIARDMNLPVGRVQRVVRKHVEPPDLPERNAEIMRRFAVCDNAAQIARDMNLPVGRVQCAIRNQVGPRQPQSGPRPHLRKALPVSEADILRMFRKCGNASHIARDLGIARKHVDDTLKAHPEARTKFKTKRTNEILRRYSECGSAAKVARDMRISNYTVRLVVSDAQDPLGDAMKQRYESDTTLTVRTVAEEFGFAPTTAHRILCAAGTKFRAQGSGATWGRSNAEKDA